MKKTKKTRRREGGREGEEDLSVKPSFGRRTAGGQLTSVAVAAAVALKISCYTVAVPSVGPCLAGAAANPGFQFSSSADEDGATGASRWFPGSPQRVWG